MTRDAWQEGKRLLDKISELSEKIKAIDDLLKRMYEVSTQYQDTIQIQLGEGYVYTPKAEVYIANFKSFLEEHKTLLGNEKEMVWKEFERL